MENKTELNRSHFDNEAAVYDTKHEKASAEIVRRVRARLEFIGAPWVQDDSSADEDEEQDAEPAGTNQDRNVRLLDYACGTGQMSRALAPYTTQCVGIDLSEKMAGVYNDCARNQGLTEDEMIAYHGNLCVPDDPDPAAFRNPHFRNFDVACVGMGFHHFDDPALAAKRLVERLKPGGVLFITDFLPHGPHHHHHHHQHNSSHGEGEESWAEQATKTVTHHGFSEKQIEAIFRDAGAGEGFAIDRMGDVVMGVNAGKRALFMARGTKAS